MDVLTKKLVTSKLKKNKSRLKKKYVYNNVQELLFYP
jgi:hypothetical protein